MPENDGGASETRSRQRLAVLELLEQHKITAAEASDILAALGEVPQREQRPYQTPPPPGDSGPNAPRSLRIRISDVRSGRVWTNVSVPLNMMGFGVNFVRRMKLGPQADHIAEAIQSGRRGPVLDVSSDNGERVEIVVE